MAKIKRVANDEINLVKFSSTELSRNFIKFTPKNARDFFDDIEIPSEIIIQLNNKKFKAIFGTQNRLFIKRKKLILSDGTIYKMKRIDSKLINLSILD